MLQSVPSALQRQIDELKDALELDHRQLHDDLKWTVRSQGVPVPADVKVYSLQYHQANDLIVAVPGQRTIIPSYHHTVMGYMKLAGRFLSYSFLILCVAYSTLYSYTGTYQSISKR